MKPAQSLPVVSLAALVAVLLAACSGSGGSGPVPVVPPTSLAVQVRATSIVLTWVDDSLSESGFAIERADGRHDFVRIAETGSNTTRFEDRGLQPVTAYHYRVHAKMPGGGDVASDVLTLQTTKPSFTGVTPATAFTTGGQRVAVHGDGFSAGVEEVHFNGKRATDLRVANDSTVICTTPQSDTTGMSGITLITPSSLSQSIDNYIYYEWPPVYQPPADILIDAPSMPGSVQMASSANSTHVVWRQDGAKPAIYAAHGRANSSWSAPTRLDHGSGQPWQPYLAVDGENTYVVWAEFGTLWLVKSNDSGVTWSLPIRIPAELGSVFHPKVVAQGKRVHVFWTDQRVRRGELYHNFSSDGGLSFESRPVRVNSGFGAFNLQVAVAGQHVYLVWFNPNGFTGIYFNRSTDAGATWGERDQQLEFRPGQLGVSPPQLTAANGYVYVLADEERQQVSLVRSADGGETWSAKQKLSRDEDVSHSPRMAVTENGAEVYVVWHSTSHPARIPGIEMNRSLDGGTTFLPAPIRVAAAPNSMDTSPVVCCSGSVVTIAYATNALGVGSQVFASSSSDGGLRWLTAQQRSPKDHGGFLPWIHCNGADVLLGWAGFDPVNNTYGLLAVRTSAR